MLAILSICILSSIKVSSANFQIIKRMEFSRFFSILKHTEVFLSFISSLLSFMVFVSGTGMMVCRGSRLTVQQLPIKLILQKLLRHLYFMYLFVFLNNFASHTKTRKHYMRDNFQLKLNLINICLNESLFQQNVKNSICAKVKNKVK